MTKTIPTLNGGTARQPVAANSPVFPYSEGGVDYPASLAHMRGVVGGLVLVEQHTASSSPSLDFTSAISAIYDEYLIELVGIAAATNAANLLMRMSTNGGTSYDSSALYDFAGHQANPGTFDGTLNAGASTTSGQVVNGVSNTSGNTVSGDLKLYGPGSANYKTVVGHNGTLKNDGNYYLTTVAGRYRNTTAVNAFQFFFSSGNIASGTIRVYGVAK